MKLTFHPKIVKTSDDRIHKSFSVTVTTHPGAKMTLSEAMARGLVGLAKKPTSVPVRIGPADIAVYTAQSLHSRCLVVFKTKDMLISLTAFGLEVADALRDSGKLQTGGAA